MVREMRSMVLKRVVEWNVLYRPENTFSGVEHVIYGRYDKTCGLWNRSSDPQPVRSRLITLAGAV